ncbi:hypothetical protein PBI_SCTP2_193 [Salicola phage SCTP-2]|nr:hypothetical protein PBI_SCTP2_193 [Salicola phage SCTP-2]
MRRNNYKNEPVKIKGCKVEVKNDNVDSALKKFKKKVDEDGRLKAFSEKMYYEKPSDLKKRKKKKAIARHKKEKQKEQEHLRRFYEN